MSILYNWKIGGEAGYGIMNTGGPIFAKTLMRVGFFVCIYPEYPSLIRGGHNTMQVAIARESITAPYWTIDQLVALNTNTIIWHQDELKKEGVLLYDAGAVKFTNDGTLDTTRIPPLTGTVSVARARASKKIRSDIRAQGIAFEKIAEEVGGSKVMRNVVAVGAALAIFERSIKTSAQLLPIAQKVLADIFAAKGDVVIKPNQAVVEAGYKAASL